MMHRNRRWCVSVVDCPTELAHMLTQRTWTLCSGFYVRDYEGYLFLNDSTHEDGASEWGIVAGALGAEQHIQVESVTFGWCDYERGLQFIQDAIAGRMDANDFARPVQLRLQAPAQHDRCHLCS